MSPELFARLVNARRVEAHRARKHVRRSCLRAREMIRRGQLPDMGLYLLEVADTFGDANAMHREARAS